jgi:hypothetical protein
MLITDNAHNFNGKMIVEICEKWKFKHLNSFLYGLKMNDVVEEVNKKHQENYAEDYCYL